ncbi:MAG: hypothetical protein GX897_00805 [Clostridiales bacterium]|nr:hypothetical protein [Clostridiales bacterium]
MNLYETMLSIEYSLILGQEYDTVAKRAVVNQLLSHRSKYSDVQKFHAGIAASLHYGRYSAFDEYGLSPMYPQLFIPPYINTTEADYGNSPYGTKYRLVTGYMPKTLLLSSNAYELGIMRLLSLFGHEDKTVERMNRDVIERLEKGILRNFKVRGLKNEHYLLAVSVLRFICQSTLDTGLIKYLVNILEDSENQKNRCENEIIFKYLAYSEIPSAIIRDTLLLYRHDIMNRLDNISEIDPLTPRILNSCLNITNDYI